MEIKWKLRYSDTLEPDKQGRWACVGYTGRWYKCSMPFKNGKSTIFQIAWVSQVKFEGDDKITFRLKPEFPYDGNYHFSTLDEAKIAIEEGFKHFIKYTR